MKYWINKVIWEDQNNQPILLCRGKEVHLAEDTVLSVGDQLRTLNGWVEVRDDSGLVVRLGPSSELVYALDPQGGNIAHPFEQLSLISSVKCTSFATTFDPSR